MKREYIFYALVFIWLAILSLVVTHQYNTQLFILEHISDLYEMVTDVYHHITNLLNMEVLL